MRPDAVIPVRRAALSRKQAIRPATFPGFRSSLFPRRPDLPLGQSAIRTNDV